jgi:predicted acylesterase/phospholipase RssA
MNEHQPFYVGLCMAGAVSAGAYTAGVMDFLIEALDDWESKRNEPGMPRHRVKIPVIGGASAGGMTGIITASAINNQIKPVTRVDPTRFFQEHSNNKFWHSWVDMTHRDMFPLLLKTNDISKGNILSLFNSAFIDDIADRALRVNTGQWIDRPYFENNLKVFTTLTSLRGVSYNIDFLGANQEPDKYCVTRHNDYVNFRLNATQYEGGWIPLDFKTGLNTGLAADAAMATGAFPVGLRARAVSRSKEFMNDNAWLKDVTDVSPVAHDPYEALNVDGGIINNEPFEKVRKVLVSLTGQGPLEYNDYNRFTSTVLMIDPFPSKPPVYNESNKLFHVIGSTLSALVNQVRVKPQHLEDAMASDKAGQYLIVPTRRIPLVDGGKRDEAGAGAIACGAFGGFSGFFHKEFRIHDYFLGRANCEKFLRDHFTVPAHASNLVTQGYAHLTEAEKERFYSRTDIEVSLPIIPVLSPRKKGKYLPVFSSGTDWPVRIEPEIDQFKGLIKARVHALIMNLADYNPLTGFLLKIGSHVVLRRKLTGVMLDLVKQSLADHHLLSSRNFSPAQKIDGVEKMVTKRSMVKGNGVKEVVE